MGASPLLSLPVAAELISLWESVPLTLKLAGHSLFCASLAPEFKSVWLVHLVLTFLWGYGGGIASSLLFMDPSRAPIALFAHNEVGVVYLLCWWLVAYLPGGAVERACGAPHVKGAIKSCTALARALLMVQRVDLAVSAYPGVAAAPLVLGTVAGCGGRLIVDAIKFGWGALAGASEISEPTFTSRSAFLASAAYWLLAYAGGVLAPREAAGLVVTGLMVQSLLTEPLGRPLDFTEPIAHFLHAVSFVPKPGQAAHARAPRARAPAPAPSPALATTPARARRAAASSPPQSPPQSPRSDGGGRQQPAQRRSTRRPAPAARTD